MGVCQHCRSEIPAGSTFCPACGKRVEAAPKAKVRFCRHCGAEVPKDARFCPACGKDVTADGGGARKRASLKEAWQNVDPSLRGKAYALLLGLVALGVAAVVSLTFGRGTVHNGEGASGAATGVQDDGAASSDADDAIGAGAADDETPSFVTTPANNLANMANGGTCVSDGNRFFFYSRATDTIYTSTIAKGASGITEVAALNLKGESEGVSCMALQGKRLLFVYAYREGTGAHQRLYSIDAAGSGDGGVILTDADLLTEFVGRKAARITTLYASDGGDIFVGADITNSSGDNDFYVFTVGSDGTIVDHNFLPIDAGRSHVVRIGPSLTVFPDGGTNDYLGSEPTAGDGSYEILYTPSDHKLLVMPMALADRAYVYEYAGSTDAKRLLEVPFDGGDAEPLIGLDATTDLISYVPCGGSFVVSVLSSGAGGSASVGLARVGADGAIDEYDLEGGSTFRDQLTLFDLGSDHFLAMSSYNEPTNNGDFVFMMGLDGSDFEILVDE